MCCVHDMMTSSNENIVRVTGPLCGEFTGHRWIPRTKASDAELLLFSLVCVWINSWVNHRKAGDLRRYRAHYDANVRKNLLNNISSNILNNVVNIFAHAIASSASEHDKPSTYRELNRDIRFRC